MPDYTITHGENEFRHPEEDPGTVLLEFRPPLSADAARLICDLLVSYQMQSTDDGRAAEYAQPLGNTLDATQISGTPVDKQGDQALNLALAARRAFDPMRRYQIDLLQR